MARLPLAPDGCPLTPSQYRIMALLADGLTYGEIAYRLGLTVSTVRTHASYAYTRLGIKGRGKAAAAVLMKDSGWLGALPREPRRAPAPPERNPVPPVLRAYAHCFTRLCRERTPRAEARVALAFALVAADRGVPRRPRNVPDIDALLLRVARGVTRPIPE